MPTKIACLTTAAALVLTSGCDYFYEVTAPAVDTTPPAGALRLFELGGDNVDIVAYSSAQSIDYETSDLDRSFVAIAATWDLQGAKSVRMNQGAVRNCVDGDIGATAHIHMGALTAEQAGGPGQVVDTGVWTGTVVSGEQAANCPGTTHLVSYTYWWSVEGENFSGQTVSGGSGSITFAP